MRRIAYIRTAIVLFLLWISGDSLAQYKVKGIVFDSSRVYRIEAVTVMSTGGRTTTTDSLGRYQIEVAEQDSIWFSFLGKPTPKYPVLKIADVSRFDISLQLKTNVMEEVKIRNRSYKMDSIQNRKDYAKVFNYQKVSVGSMTSIGSMGAAIDLQELIRLFQFRKNKATLKFQERLLEQERTRFVDHRFNKNLVKRLTSLDGEELDRFMTLYRPTYEFTLAAGEYDFQLYIKTAFGQFKGQGTRSF
ncbi:MAG TPA: hypothetical protein VFR58_00520 [Flavisolibacter sp.]|nr:hypothetical protein [Flavisolibacter sp.]